MSTRNFLSIIFVAGLLVATWFGGEVKAQGPDKPGSPTSTPQTTATPALVPTGSGWIDASALPPAAISAQAFAPVNCNTMAAPVVGFEISKGQDSNDITDLANDLSADGFSLGTVNISAGPIPTCVDLLIVQGLAQNLSLTMPYTAAEAGQIQTWVANGHGLLLSGEWGTFANGTAALFQAYGYSLQGPNPVTDPTDFESPAPPPANSWVIYQTDNFGAHPALSGVSSIEMLTSSWLSSGANAIISADADATPANAPVMAAFTDGVGCAVLVADSNWNTVVGAATGYLKQDNARAARQLVQWLSSCSKLTLTKSATPNPVQAGQILNYTLTATNQVNPSVTGVVITDVVPAGSVFVAATTPHQGPNANGIITWPLGTLNLNATAVVTMAVQVNTGLANNTVIPNSAYISSNEGLTDTATVLVNVSTPILQGSVAGLVWQDSNGNAIFDAALEPVLPNITVVVTDSLGAPQLLNTNAGGQYTTTVNAGPVTVAVDQTDPDLPPAHTLSTANSPTALNVTAGSVISANFGFKPSAPQLYLDLQVTPAGTISAGDRLTYTLVFSNSSLITATNVVITDLVPANSTFVSGTLVTDIGAAEFYDGLNWLTTQPNTVVGVHVLIPTLPPNGVAYHVSLSVQVDTPANTNQIINQALLNSTETTPQTDTEINPVNQINLTPPLAPPPEEKPNDDPSGNDDDDSDPQENVNVPPVIPKATPQPTGPPLPVNFLPDTGVNKADSSIAIPDILLFGLSLVGTIYLFYWGLLGGARKRRNCK